MHMGTARQGERVSQRVLIKEQTDGWTDRHGYGIYSWKHAVNIQNVLTQNWKFRETLCFKYMYIADIWGYIKSLKKGVILT